MAVPASNVESGSSPDSVASRQGSSNDKGKRTAQQARERTGMRSTADEMKILIAEMTRKGVAELQRGESEFARAMLDDLRNLHNLATRDTNNPLNDDISRNLREITRRLTAIEASAKTSVTPSTTASSASGAPSWSQIAAGGLQQRARIELRLEKRGDGITETTEEQLARIQKAIPGAQAIITHPRSSEKISVLVSSSARRDQILQAGIQGLEGAKVIRRPRLVMVSGISLGEAIKNRKCDENEEWIKKVQRKNPGIIIERVAWLYTDKDLSRRRAEGKQKKGSIILSMATEAMQHQAVRQGLLVGAEWHPVSIWDISLTDGQCFRCHQWGHNQSVCNAPKELCGHCAGSHSSRDCKTKEDTQSSCAACKQKGHKAWMTKTCRAYEAFRAKNEVKKKEMVQATAAIQKEGYSSSGRSSPSFNFSSGSSQSNSEWRVVDSNKRKRVGRPTGIESAGRHPSQSRLTPMESTTASAATEDVLMSTQ